MKKLSSLLFLLIISLSFTAFAQSMNCQLDITVTAKNGESLSGVAFELMHTDYSLSYPGTVLDAQGKFSTKVYAGPHHIKIAKAGLNTYEADFEVTTAGKQLNIELEEAVRVPFALKAKTTHDIMSGKNDIHFSWNKEEPVFFDDFESHNAWAINFGQWTGIDGDQLATAALAGDYSNRGGFQYAQIISPLKVDPVWWYEYPVLRPFGGQQYVGFIRTNSGEANDDWLISPMVTIGNENVVSFMAKAGDRWPERFEVCITNAENPTVNDFVALSSGNYETVTYEQWVKKEYDLSAYVGQNVKIAIHYMSEAARYGAFMLMVDDFFIGQVEKPLNKNMARRAVKAANANESFEVYLDGKKYSTVKEPQYVFFDVPAGNHTVGVKAVYATAETEIVSLPVTVSADYAELRMNVTANNDEVINGLTLSMIEKTSGEAYNFPITNGAVVLPSLPFGTYLLNIKSDAFEEYNQTVEFTGKKTMDIVLKEIIFNPSNITINSTENAAGTFDVAASWNKDLGYTEGFESMPDFATGSFGGWRSIDVDKMPVYPIALGDITNVVSFPGSGTQTSPTPIAPMVFNPYKTVPAMAPADPAIMAPEGNKTIAFFSTMQTRSDKWLISPQQHINADYVVKFVAKAYASFPEIIEVCVSTEDDAIENFVKMDRITLDTQWTEYELDLSAYKDQKIYIGIHYVSTDAFLAQMDVFYVGPKNEASAKVGNVLEYEVYLDNALLGKTKESNYNFKGLSAGSHTIGIKAIYKTGASEMTNYTFNLVAGVEEFETSAVAVVGLDGAIKVVAPQAADVAVFNMAGQVVVADAVEGEAELPVNAGLYIVKVGTDVFKVAVK